MDPRTAMQMERRLQQEVTKLKKISTDLNNLMGPRSKYLSQQNENEMVAKVDTLPGTKYTLPDSRTPSVPILVPQIGFISDFHLILPLIM